MKRKHIKKLMMISTSVLFLISCNNASSSSQGLSNQTSSSQSTANSTSSTSADEFVDYLVDSFILNESEEMIRYGVYPQTVVVDQNLIHSLDAITKRDVRGYIQYQNELYFKYSGLAYESHNGDEIVAGEHYYKVEPIQWRILQKESDVIVMSEYILDSHRFNESYEGIYKNEVAESNYAKSEIRGWLNNDFISMAFKSGDQIKVAHVDNSIESTRRESSDFLCEDTEDKMFLPSIHDLTNTDYGFVEFGSGYSADENRVTTRTDFAKARCTATGPIDHLDLCEESYWTRTAYVHTITFGDETMSPVYVAMGPNGGRIDVPSSVDYTYGYYSNGGVRPMSVFSQI